MTSQNVKREPAAYRLDDSAVSDVEITAIDELEPGEQEISGALETLAHPERRPFRLGKVLVWSAGLLVSLAFGLWLEGLIVSLFSRAEWLGWAGVGLVALFVCALLGMVLRELFALARLRKVADLRLRAEKAISENDDRSARSLAKELIGLYSGRADTARGRSSLSGHLREVMDGRDLLVLAERDLLTPLDLRARQTVMQSAKRVSVVTAVSPRALVDVAFVIWESARLIRQLATLYGGRPGFFGLIHLVRAVVQHLVVTGSIAIGESLLQQLIGHGLAARLSARFGEGVVNGLMTARIGLSAMDVSRPLPFAAEARPKLADLTSDLVNFGRAAVDQDE